MGSFGRLLSGGVAVLAVAGCAAVAVAMSGVTSAPGAQQTPFSMPSWTPRADPVSQLPDTASTVTRAPSDRPSLAASTSVVPATRHARTSATAPARPTSTTQPPPAAPRPPPAAKAPAAAPSASARPAPLTGGPLPLRYSASGAAQVITVVAPSTGSTSATLQAWTAAPGGGWLRYGPAIPARVGSDGMSATPSEYRSATPMGSFTLTQAFGRMADPGTRISYFQSTPADWWISQSGPLYNTHQRCSGSCPFTQGDPNEHLYYITPEYDYAVVIDYNTRNAGPVRQGAGSAFFLHVTDGSATAGCVSIPRDSLVSLLRWLNPSAHPRILIGTG